MHIYVFMYTYVCIHTYVYLYVHIHVYKHMCKFSRACVPAYEYVCVCVCARKHTQTCGCVGGYSQQHRSNYTSLLQKETYTRDAILQKRPVILSILLTVATPSSKLTADADSDTRLTSGPAHFPYCSLPLLHRSCTEWCIAQCHNPQKRPVCV